MIRIDLNVCRVCKSSVCSTSLFSDTNLAEKFCYLTGLQASNGDGLPTKLCEKCVARLKIAADFKEECHIADSHFRKFIEKVNAQFQELTILNETPKNEHEIELLLSTSSTSLNKFEIEKNAQTMETTRDFIHGMKLQPQSTKKESNANLQQQVQQAKLQNREIYVEPYDLANSDHIEEDEELEETIEEYQTPENPQVVYISLEDKRTYPFVESQSVASNENNLNKESQQKNNQNIEKEETNKNIQHYCSQCNKSFSTKTNLFRHVATHDGRRPYACTICQKRFSQNSSLKQHNLLHTGEKPFKCNVCERSFTQAKSLTFHMRRHTGEKPFVCAVCNVQFRQKDGMKRHVLLKHTSKEAPREIFSCDICSKVLFSRYSLANHKRKHTSKNQGDKETVVVKCLN